MRPSSRKSQACRGILASVLAAMPCIAVAAQTDAPALRQYPYPFSHAASFSSDVDMQSPSIGVALHRVFNVELGLNISDSLWPHGSSLSSVLFLGPDTLNRQPSGIGGEPVYALLLRQWHRGNIDHFHGWQDDNIYQIRNDFPEPVVLRTGKPTVVNLPAAPQALWGQRSQNLRLYFSAPPPSDLRVVLYEAGGASFAFDPHAVHEGLKVIPTGQQAGMVTELIIPASAADGGTMPININKLERVELATNGCQPDCDAKLVRLERDHFSRLTVKRQLQFLERWNIRPAFTTSHGGNTLASAFGVPGRSTKLARAPGTLLEDPTIPDVRTTLANVEGSPAYHADLLRDLSILGVWPYFAEVWTDWFHTVGGGANTSPMPMTTTFKGLYNVPRTTIAWEQLEAPTDRARYLRDLKKFLPTLTEEELGELYCGPTCDISQGDALALIAALTLQRTQQPGPTAYFWYTHFGAYAPDTIHTLQQPISRATEKWMQRLANAAYNFDHAVNDRDRIWIPPAGTWWRYQVMRAAIQDHLSVSSDGNTVNLTSWTDPVTGRKIPDPLASTRDLHGLSIYVKEASRASVLLDGHPITAITRDPADASGRQSISIVDDNTPTVIIGAVSLDRRGSLRVSAGTLAETRAGQQPTGTSLQADAQGRAVVAFTPYDLTLWNTSHLDISFQKRAAPGAANVSGRFQLELHMADGGVIAIAEEGVPTSTMRAGDGIWHLPALTQAGRWQRQILNTAQLSWPVPLPQTARWGRPALPVGRVKTVRLVLEGAKPGEFLDIGSIRALRPSGNGEAADGSKVVAGRVTTEGVTALPKVLVTAKAKHGAVMQTTTDQDGYYFFYNQPRGEILDISARVGDLRCHTRQGKSVEILKNEVELDISTSTCL